MCNESYSKEITFKPVRVGEAPRCLVETARALLAEDRLTQRHVRHCCCD